MINYIEIMKKLLPILIFKNFNYCSNLKTEVKKIDFFFFFKKRKFLL